MSAGGEDEGPKEEPLQKFWLRGQRRRSAAAQNRNVMEDNPLNIIRRAFESFSEEEQHQIQRHKYGGEQPAEENTAFVNDKLHELDKEISLISENIRKPYMEAVQQEIEHSAAAELATAVETGSGSVQQQQQQQRGMKGDASSNDKEHVRSKPFRLMFLRAENFNARMAARRIVSYFKEKKELFGMDKLSKRIKQSDFTEFERNELLNLGFFCSTGATDTHGRVIFYFCRKLADQIPVDSFRRIAIYFYQIMIEDNEEWQKKGIVVVGDGRSITNLPKLPSSERRVYPLYRMCMHTLPCKVACWHVCYDDLAFHFFLRLSLLIVPAKFRSMMQTHYVATAQEAFASLSEYGISMENLPLTEELGFERESLKSLLDVVRQKEDASNDHWLTKEILQWL